MQIFLDTANLEEIKEAASWGIISGVTTNPSLVSKEGSSFKELVLEICKIVSGPISAEAVSLEASGIIKEARDISKWHSNIVIKVPLIPEGLKAIKVLSSEGIKTNATLVFSIPQAILAATAGADFVSPFVGRLDDIGSDGMQLIYEMVPILKSYGFKSKIITASIRHPMHVVQAAQAGSDIATIPFKILQQMVKHPLTDRGIERFLEDWKKVPKPVS